MNSITLQNVLPVVFSHRQDLQSDIWLQQVELQKGSLYLIEADSGTGKSSLCSYLVGYRRDYQGTILFDGTDIRSYGVGEWT